MNKAKKIFAGMLAGVMALSFAACSGGKTADKTDTTAAPAQKTDITVCLDWTPNTNHTGMFVAKEKGYYEAAGLNVSIVQPPDNSTATQLCSSNKAQFAVDAQDTLAPAFTSDTPMDVTAVAALLQHNSSGIISKAGQGMDRPKGLTGNTYLTWDSPIEKAMLENIVNKDGGNWSKVKQIPNTVTAEAQDVQQNPDHAIWVFYGWGGINAKVNKIDVDFFYIKDLNATFDYYTPVLIANNTFLKENPQAAKAFLAATAKGYQYAIDHPEEAADILIKSDDTGSLNGSEELVKESQKWMADQYISDAKKWGYIDPARWNNFYKWLTDNKLVEKDISSNVGFTNDYLA